jgi:hypothetical protein
LSSALSIPALGVLVGENSSPGCELKPEGRTDVAFEMEGRAHVCFEDFLLTGESLHGIEFSNLQRFVVYYL